MKILCKNCHIIKYLESISVTLRYPMPPCYRSALSDEVSRIFAEQETTN